MRAIIRDQVSHKFIEGPMQFNPAHNRPLQAHNEKASYSADLSPKPSVKEDNDDDRDIPYYQVNERYD